LRHNSHVPPFSIFHFPFFIFNSVMRYVWISSLLLLVVGFAFGPALISREPAADEELKIVSPHWEGIRREFGRAFTKYYFEKTGKHIHVTFLDIGGSTEIRKYVEQRFTQVGPTEGINIDVLFGGGMEMLPGMAAKHLFEPYKPSPELIAEIPPDVAEMSLRDKDFLYHATCLSTFGFVYNTQVVELAHLPSPNTWNDLGRDAMHGWVTSGDPGSAGSLHLAFELVLQGEHWENGCATLNRMVSNSRAFNEGGTSVPRDVSLGQAAVGPCIDFYASAPVRRQGATHLKLVVPEGMAVPTPDCIAKFRSPPNPRAADAFIEFVLSEAGERLWYQRRGDPGGPVEYDLERLPVMPKIYEMGLPTNTVVNPFKTKPSFNYDGKKAGGRWGILNDLWKTTWIDVHEDHWAARSAAIKAGREDLETALARAPMSEEALFQIAKKKLSSDQSNALKNKWTAWARGWYQSIQRAAECNGPVPEFVPAPTE
jgi:ABC-type Fe3+ transport system substrate-binding protein